MKQIFIVLVFLLGISSFFTVRKVSQLNYIVKNKTRELQEIKGEISNVVNLQEDFFTQGFTQYNPLIQGAGMKTLSDVIKKKTVVLRVSEYSCSKCVEDEIEQLAKCSFKNFDKKIICPSKYKLGKWKRIYDNLQFLACNESLKCKKSNDKYEMIYAILNEECRIINVLTPMSFKEWVKINMD